MTDNLIPFPTPPPKSLYEQMFDWTPEQWAEWSEEQRRKEAEFQERERRLPLRARCTRNTLGTAAAHILDGDVTATRIDAIIADCAWCQIARYNRECWHHAAKLLFAHGLDTAPLPAQPALFDIGEADA
jgi:hypothetical protein